MKETKEKPHVEHFIGESGDEIISKIIFSHLNLENLLEEVIRFNLMEPKVLNFERMMFAQKNTLCCAIGAIDLETYRLLKAINDFRNKAAHKFRFQPTYEQIFELTKKASNAGVDFTDGLGGSVEHAKDMAYDREGLIEATFQNVFFHIAFLQPQSFSDDYIG